MPSHERRSPLSTSGATDSRLGAQLCSQLWQSNALTQPVIDFPHLIWRSCYKCAFRLVSAGSAAAGRLLAASVCGNPSIPGTVASHPPESHANDLIYPDWWP